MEHLENGFTEKRLNEVVSNKVAGLLADGYKLYVSDNEAPEKYFRYYRFVKYDLNGYLEDAVAIGIMKKVISFSEYAYIVHVLDYQDFVVEEELEITEPK